MEKNICIFHHLGLGDTIECNGMIRHYAEIFSNVDIFSFYHNYENISRLFRDNLKIKIHKINQENEYHEVNSFLSKYDGNIIIPGHNAYFNNINYFYDKKMSCGEAFYYIANIPYQYRNSKFFLERDIIKEENLLKTLNPHKERFIFVHDDPTRGFVISEKKYRSDLKIIKNRPDFNIFDLIYTLENAEEIHCMPSSILCLIDCLTETAKFKKLFLHNIRNVYFGPNSLINNWQIIQ